MERQVEKTSPHARFGQVPQRAWRLHYALRQMVKRWRCSGSAVQVVSGHVINPRMDQRCCLSVHQTVWWGAHRLGSRVGELAHFTLSKLCLVLIAHHGASRSGARATSLCK